MFVMRKRLMFGALGCVLAMATHDAAADTSNLVIGARAQGLGSAYSAVADDASAAFWNPAAMSRLSRPELTYSHWTLSNVDNVGVDFAAIAVPFALGALEASAGFSFTRVGAQLEEGPNGTTSDISDSRFALVGGLRLSRIVSVGLSFNRLEVNSERESGAGFGLDAAVFVEPVENHDVRFAIVGRNLSTDVKNEDLDQAWRIGGAWTFLERRVTVAAESGLRRDIDAREGVSGLFFMGIEATPREEFALRFGGGSRSQWGIGFGVNHRGFAFDYAFSDDDEVIGSSHRVTVSVAFGDGRLGQRPADSSPSGGGE
jgi:long-subunit fatty acid transport protein